VVLQSLLSEEVRSKSKHSMNEKENSLRCSMWIISIFHEALDNDGHFWSLSEIALLVSFSRESNISGLKQLRTKANLASESFSYASFALFAE
jgi:uncharacterized protein YfaT (DUF1175 family)